MQQRIRTRQPRDKRLDMFIVRKVPCRAIKPEGVLRRERQDRLCIHEIADGERGQKGARRKLDDKPLGPLVLNRKSRFCQGALNGGLYSSMLFEEEQVPTAIGWTNRSVIASSSPTPDHFYIRGVRCSSL